MKIHAEELPKPTTLRDVPSGGIVKFRGEFYMVSDGCYLAGNTSPCKTVCPYDVRIIRLDDGRVDGINGKECVQYYPEAKVHLGLPKSS